MPLTTYENNNKTQQHSINNTQRPDRQADDKDPISIIKRNLERELQQTISSLDLDPCKKDKISKIIEEFNGESSDIID